MPEAKPQIQQEATQVTTNILATNTIEKENLTQGLTSKKASVIKTQKTIAETQKVIAETITQKPNPILSANKDDMASASTKNSNVQQSTSNTFFSKGKVATDSPLITRKAVEVRASILNIKEQVPSLANLNLAYDSEFQLPDIVKCGDKKDRRLNMNFTTSMDVFVSPERSFRILEYKADDYAEYAARRNETEKAYYSFSSGLRFNVLADNGLALRTGIVYSQINEIFEEQFLETRILTDPTTGDTLGFTQLLNDVTTFNRYKMVDVPLMIGYEMPMKRSTINVNAGIFVNVQATQKGNLLDEEGTKVDFTTGSGDYEIFRKNIGVSYFMSIGAAYDLSPQYQFFFEPHLRYYPSSFTKTEHVLNQKYITGGILLGIRKKL